MFKVLSLAQPIKSHEYRLQTRVQQSCVQGSRQGDPHYKEFHKHAPGPPWPFFPGKTTATLSLKVASYNSSWPSSRCLSWSSLWGLLQASPITWSGCIFHWLPNFALGLGGMLELQRLNWVTFFGALQKHERSTGIIFKLLVLLGVTLLDLSMNYSRSHWLATGTPEPKLLTISSDWQRGCIGKSGCWCWCSLPASPRGISHWRVSATQADRRATWSLRPTPEGHKWQGADWWFNSCLLWTLQTTTFAESLLEPDSHRFVCSLQACPPSSRCRQLSWCRIWGKPLQVKTLRFYRARSFGLASLKNTRTHQRVFLQRSCIHSSKTR